ncbi:MAG: ATP-binding protein [Planctomycetota bacterium]
MIQSFRAASQDPTGEPNPFSTRFVSPGMIAYKFDDELSPKKIANTFLTRRHQVAQIVGPHGSGKSTLLRSLFPHLRRNFEQIVEVNIRGSSSIDSVCLRGRQTGEKSELTEPRLLVVDGIERLPLTSTIGLVGHCLFAGTGLLITTHRRSPVLPVLFETRPQLTVFQQIVHELQVHRSDKLITRDCCADVFQANKGDIRESLMTLYDLWEDRR